MKKSLFLLPLLAGLALCGCDKGGNGGGTGTGGGTGGGGGGGGTYTQVAKLDLKSDHTTTKSDEQVVIENSGVTLTVDKEDAQNPCGGQGQAYVANPLRVYGGQKVTIEYSKAFKQLVFDCPVFDDNNYSEFLVEAIETDGAGSAEADGKTVTVTLDEAVTEWSYTNVQISAGWKQNRYYSVILKA